MDICQAIYQGGVIGAGGAGFPTHKKFVSPFKTLIINGAECEPLLNSDQYVMRTFAKELVETLAALKKQLHVNRVVIGVKKKYVQEIDALTDAIKKRRMAVEIHPMESFYPAGDEQVLIHEITGQTVPPGEIPIALGIVVINVTTLYNISKALEGLPVTKRYVSVTGSVAAPKILKVPLGTKVRGCIEAAGGASISDYAVIAGGPMMGKLYTGDEIDQLSITKTDGGIIVIPEDHYINRFNSQRLCHIINQAKSACIQCNFCTDMCPRYLIGHKMRPNKVMRAVATGADPLSLTDALLCCECGVCEMYACPMGLSPRKVCKSIKDKLREGGLGPDKSVDTAKWALRPGRSIAQNRLIGRLDLSAYPSRLETMEAYQPDIVTIPLKQGIGKPAQPIVSPGNKVSEGDIIGQVAFEDVGSMVHASITGIVKTVNTAITIEKGGQPV